MSALPFIFSLGYPLVLGWVIIAAIIDPPRHNHGAWLMMVLSMGSITGYAIVSGLYFLWMYFIGPQRWLMGYVTLELTVLLIFSVIVYKRRNLREFRISAWVKGITGIHLPQIPIWEAGVAGIFIWYLLSFIANLLSASISSPHGDWDAWAIWNLAARFFYSGDFWERAFSSEIFISHPDYPLLLPSLMARSWSILQARSLFVPVVVGNIFLLSIVGMLFAWTWRMRGLTHAWLAGLFATTVTRAGIECAQLADLPLAAYLLAVFILLFEFDSSSSDKKSLFVLNGFLAGAMVWLKNEGWIILIAISSTTFFIVLWELKKLSAVWRRARWFFFGVLPLLIVTLLFKVTLAPLNDMVANLTTRGFYPIFDGARYELIGQSLLTQFYSFRGLRIGLFPLLIVLALVMGLQIPASKRLVLARQGLSLLIIIGAYFGAYLMTYLDLNWHLSTSLWRLVAQLAPSIILWFFAAISSPTMNLSLFDDINN